VKKIVLISLCLMMNYTGFADNHPLLTPNPLWPTFTIKPTPPSPMNPVLQSNFLQLYSSQVIKIIRAYEIRSNAQGTFYYPSLDSEKHVNEEYRPAWEEMFRDCALDRVILNRLGMPTYYIVAALSELASTNSIPFLVNTYKEILEKSEWYRDSHLVIFHILFKINTTEALDAVFAMLDLSDEKIGYNTFYNSKTHMTLRDIILSDFLETQHQGTIFTYQNLNLSKNNHEFLKKMQDLMRTQQEQNVDAPLP